MNAPSSRACALVMLLPALAFAGPNWQEFHPLPGQGSGTEYQSRLTGLSADGMVATGYISNGGFQQAVVWIDGQMELLPGAASRSVPEDLSGDGRVIVGSSYIGSTFYPTVWERVDGAYQRYFVSDLPGGGTFGKIYAVSRDGSRAVGVGRSIPARAQGTYWELSNGPGAPAHGLGYLQPWNIQWSEAYAVSADGSVVVGTGRNNEGYLGLSTRIGEVAPEPGVYGIDASSEIWGVSADGRYMLGACRSPGAPATDTEPTIWTDGVPEILPLIPGLNYTGGAYAGSITDDGSIILGSAYIDGASVRMMWVNKQPRLFSEFLEDLAIIPEGWTSVRGSISPDGRFLAGNGINPAGLQQAFVAVIPAPGTAALLGVAAAAGVGRRRRA